MMPLLAVACTLTLKDAGTAEGILPSWIVLDDLYGRFKLAILDRIVAEVIVAAVAAEDAVGFQNGHSAIPIGIGLTAYRNVAKFDNVKTLNLRHDPLLLCPHRNQPSAVKRHAEIVAESHFLGARFHR